MITLYDSMHTEISLKVFKFPGGEMQVEVGDGGEKVHYVRAALENSDDVMTFLLVTDALWRMRGYAPVLDLRYVPYAQQDRVMEPGQALSAQVISFLINAMDYERVQVWDPHSDVISALIHKIDITEQWQMVQRVPLDRKNTILVSPDGGALKKTAKIHKNLSFAGLVRADKTRSTLDGSITGTVVYSESVGDKDFLICDDICVGGKTFTELAKELKKLTTGKIYLYVTHGIFSHGLDVFDGLIDHLYVANPFSKVDLSNPKITKLNLQYPNLL